MTSRATDEQIVAMLRAGASHLEIKAQLRVGGDRITRARREAGIDPEPGHIRYTSDDERREVAERRYPHVVAMLRDGATYRQIIAATGHRPTTISRVRRLLDIPVPARPNGAQTIAEALARHVQPHGDGHARWTGPHSDGHPHLWSHGRNYNGRREIFRAHHGRDPQGPVTTTCDQPRCIAGAHLADDLTRQAARQLDATYTAIFGPDAP
ncbi:Trp family transcriptional regulator [Streptomyces antibioticus]|uniref:Trp family transcriptional regulator n=1 Tax=Streptomyces antibioticus TaxID=1890 RepID=UPI00369BCE66